MECARAPGARRFRVIFRTSFEVFKFSHSVDYVSGYDPNFSGHSLHDSAHSAGPDLEGSAKKIFLVRSDPIEWVHVLGVLHVQRVKSAKKISFLKKSCF